ncbi:MULTISPECIES: cell wall metabolism sensor histidine kinase WalK [unclassified Leucobacter]|uniref:sensor histidine kinase n=1 Tax=unclassified Leucobacter TaxID=2621730 RepID=UPI00165EA013|nr:MULTISPECIES: HAMP domain-containing sensor histidine kinase [unclassified Leucobacter]MBC9928222.1 HAMP domain-containing histidine kinase [Leucobacter sp. cx-169]MBC9937522.1 HAMP domain-containing histidine kinase [Leucobacter sp. cx-87]
MTAERASRARRVLSLRARLLIASSMLAALAILTVGGIAVGELQRSLSAQVDNQLEHAFGRAADVVAGAGPTSLWSTQGPLDATTVLQGPAQAPGTLAVVLREGTLTGGTIGQEGEVLPLPRDILDGLVGLPLDGTMHTLELGPESGNYRLIAGQADRTTVVVGLPLAPVEATSARIALTVGLSTAVAVLAMLVVGSLMIRRSLRPLETLARTADEAATRQLATGGDIGLDRIDLAGADPRSEVGRVLTAYNRMVGNVEGALRDREESEQQVRRFVADASHELRTPLASIRGYSEFVRRMGSNDLPEDIVRSIGRIEAESLRMQALVEDLLLLTRIDQGQELRLQSVDLTGVLRNAIADAAMADPDRTWVLEGAELTDPAPIFVHADPHRLHQVFANLLGNARAHTPSGTRVAVRVRIDYEAERVAVEIADNGPGIPADVLPRVFERFVRGDAQRVRTDDGGTGLGLPIVAALVHAFGGEVRAAGGSGGAIITVELRLVCLDGQNPLG